jgi:Tfp pilus assembly protein PilO
MKIDRGTVRLWAALLGLLALFAGGVLLPYGIKDARLRERIEAARADLGIGEVDNAGLVRLYGEVEDLREQVGGRGQYVPNEDEISLVLQDLTLLINAPGVTGQEIITNKTKMFLDYNILPVKMQFSAPFATAYDLVRRIESLSRVVRVDGLELEAQDDYPFRPLVVSLELSAFYASDNGGGQR